MGSYQRPPNPIESNPYRHSTAPFSPRAQALDFLARGQLARTFGIVIPSPHPTHLYALYLGPPSDLLYPWTTDMSQYLIFWGGWGIPEIVRRSLVDYNVTSQALYQAEIARREDSLKHIQEWGIEMFVVARNGVAPGPETGRRARIEIEGFVERIEDVVDEMCEEVDAELGFKMELGLAWDRNWGGTEADEE